MPCGESSSLCSPGLASRPPTNFSRIHKRQCTSNSSILSWYRNILSELRVCVVKLFFIFFAYFCRLIGLRSGRSSSKAITFFFALLFIAPVPAFRATAQEHVDVPLPPYDPPPTVSHHSESHTERTPRVSEQTRSEYTTRSANVRTYHHTHSYRHLTATRRHRFFHWPWQHEKRDRSRH